MALFYFLTIILVSSIVAIPAYFLGRRSVRRRKEDLVEKTLLLIRVPSADGGAGDFRKEMKKFEDFLRRLASFHRECCLEMCVEHIGADIHFHVSVPRAFVSSVKEEIYLLWRGARVDEAHNEPGIFRSRGVSVGGYLMQKKDHVFSVKTHRVLEANPFASILAAFSNVSKIAEGVGVQIVLRPVSGRHKKSIARSLASVMRGDVGEIVKRSKLIFKEGIHVPDLGAEIEERKKREAIRKDIFNFARSKLSQPIFEANVRVCVSAGTKFRAEEILDEIAASFSHFDDPYHNEFKFVKPRNPEKLVEHFVARRFSEAEVVVLSSEEIASFYHFPTIKEEAHRGMRLWSKQISATSGFLSAGICIGENEFHGEKNPVFISDENPNRHLFVVGERHTGKSTLIGNMIIQDIERGNGVALIDFKGKLAKTLLGRIPQRRAHEAVYLNMADTTRVPGIDVFHSGRASSEKKVLMAREIGDIVKRFFTLETMGIMFDEYVRNGLLLLLEGSSGNANVLDLPRVFVDKRYRAKLLSKSKNNELAHFWEYEARSPKGEAALHGIAPFVLSRFEKFASSEHIRSIFQDPASAVDIDSMIAEKKIIFFDLQEDVLGEFGSRFLGMMIINKILSTSPVNARSKGGGKRKTFNLYLDGSGGYIPDSVAKIISGNKDLHANISLSMRSVKDLTSKTYEAIFAHRVSKIAFRVSPRDADILISEFTPSFTKSDLVCVDDFNAHARIAVRGELSAPFTIKIATDSWSVGNAKIANKIKEHSRKAYYRDIRELEKKALENAR